jgi:hypothetical protein
MSAMPIIAGTVLAGLAGAAFVRSKKARCDGMGPFIYTTVSDVLQDRDFDNRHASCICCQYQEKCDDCTYDD